MKTLESFNNVPGLFGDDKPYRLATVRMASGAALHMQIPNGPGDYTSTNVYATPELVKWIMKQAHEYGSLSASGKGYVKVQIRSVDMKKEKLAVRPNSPTKVPESSEQSGLIRLQCESPDGPNYNVIDGHSAGCDVILSSPQAAYILNEKGV